MFRKFAKAYSVQTSSKLVRDNPDGSSPITDSVDVTFGPEIAEAYSEILKDLITHAAVTIGVTYSICKIIGRICR